MFTKKIKLIKKFIVSRIFIIFYGEINKIISSKDFKKARFKKKNYKIYTINKGRVFSDTVNDTAYISKNILIKDPSYQFRLNQKYQVFNDHIKKNIVLKYGTPKIKKKIKKTVVSLLSGGAAKSNYWHWMFDTLPRIGILEKGKVLQKDFFYLAPSLKMKYQLETLLALGFQKKYLLDGEKNKHLQAKKIIATDHPIIFKNNPSISINNIPLWVINWLRKKYLNQIKIKNFISYKKIYIERRGGINFHNRKIINNEDVKRIILDEGFKIIILESLSFLEQVNLFHNAKTIVGLHGAGLTNVIFCKPGTKVIEIQSHSTGNANRNLAKKCRLNYKRIVEKNLSSNVKFQNFHINVNILKLKKILTS